MASTDKNSQYRWEDLLKIAKSIMAELQEGKKSSTPDGMESE